MRILCDAAPAGGAAIVAVSIVALIAVIMSMAIWKYEVGDGVKIWALLGPLTGLVSGAIGSYFFTQPTIEASREIARQSTQDALTTVVPTRDALQKSGTLELAKLPESAVNQLVTAHLPATRPVRLNDISDAKVQIDNKIRTLQARLSAFAN